MITALMHPAQRGLCNDYPLHHRIWCEVAWLLPITQRRSQSTGDGLGDEWPAVYMAAPQPFTNLAPRAFSSSCSLVTVSA